MTVWLLVLGLLAWTSPFEITRKDGRQPTIVTYVLWGAWAAAVLLSAFG